MLKNAADFDVRSRLEVPTTPPVMAELLSLVYLQLGLDDAALRIAIEQDRLQLSGEDIAVAADPQGNVLVAAADLGPLGLASIEQMRQALRANLLLMLHAGTCVARGHAGPGSGQLIGRLPVALRTAQDVAQWLTRFARLARAIRDTARGRTENSPP